MKGLIPTSLASFTTVGYLLSTVPVCAQIVPDNSLGPDSSRVTPRVIRGIPSDRIDGGLERGNNLFHSFEEFNVEAGRGAFFANPDNIANILSRVTGGNISNIFGTLGVLGNANLFLVNPNGIVFGLNARLDVSGSFFATTNNGFIFENGFEFVASNSNAPPLLTINIPIGLRLRENPGTIENQSVAFLNDRNDVVGGLQVPFRQTLGLVGGEVILDSGALIAPGGRIEVAGVSGVGTIQLNTEENSINGLQISTPVTREDITLTNNASLDVASSRGGDITIDGRNVTVSQSSFLLAGIAPEEGNPETQAGDIKINAAEDFQLLNDSFINNRVELEAQGNAGDTRITANNVFINGNAQLSSSSFGRGNAGNVIIRANERTSIDNDSVIFSTLRGEAEGLGGNIRITTGDLSLSNGSQLQTLVEGIGDAGNIDITASRSVSLSSFPTRILSSIEAGGIGKSGDINITTGSLSVSDGAFLRASVRGPNDENMLPAGQGNAGIININATGRVSFDGVDSGAFSELEFRPPDENQEMIESGGSIQINAGSVFVTNGAELRVSTDRLGDAGNITINAQNLVSFDNGGRASSTVGASGRGKSNGININTGSLRVTNGAFLDVATFGIGDAGQVAINATDAVSFSNGARAFSTVEAGAIGNSAGINISARSLNVSNGAALTASVVSEKEPGVFVPTQGQAGDVNINVTETVSFNGEGSRAESILDTDAVGGGGNIFINAGSLWVTNGAYLDAATFGIGNGGQVAINATETVTFSNGARVFSRVESEAEGNGAGISINATNLSVTNGAFLDAATFGEGNAGSVIINTPNNGSVIFDGADESGQLSSAFSAVELGAVGDGGNIEITTGSLSVTNGAQLRAETKGEGNADSIIINAPNGSVIFDGTTESGSPSRAVSVVTESATGDGGSIEINTGSLSVTNGALLDAAAFGDGNAGGIIVQASGDVVFDGFFDENTRSAASSTLRDNPNIDNQDSQGGNIEISARNLTVSNGAQLLAETRRQGNAGNIIINTTENLFVTDNAALDVSTFDEGDAGDIIVEAQGNVLFDDATAFSTVVGGANGNSGNINITAGNLSVINGGRLRVEVEPLGTGNAGNIFVNAADSVLFDGISESGRTSGAFSSLEENAVGEAGSIDIVTNRLTVTNGAQLRVQTSGRGNAGNINILANDSVLFQGGAVGENFNPIPSRASSIVDFSGQGDSGSITITTGSLSVLNGASLETLVRGNNPERFVTAGSIQINATGNVIFDGVGTIDSFAKVGNEELIRKENLGGFPPSQALTQIESGIFGDSGDITINTQNLSITNGAQLQASNYGVGTAGNIVVNAIENVFFDGVFLSENNTVFPSRAATILGLSAVGIGGDVNIKTTNLSVTNGARLDVRTFGLFGFAGNAIIEARDSIFFDGFFNDENVSGAFATAQVDRGNELDKLGFAGSVVLTAENISLSNFAQLQTAAFGFGLAGDIFVTTGNLLATDNATIQAQVNGLGEAGDVGITARNSISIDNSGVLTTLGSESFGEGGGIEINTGNLFVTNGGQLQAQVNEDAEGDAGKVLINASDSVFFEGRNIDGFPSQAFTSIGEGATGTGGDITINTQNLSVTNGAGLSASVLQQSEGNAGTITINAAERVYFDGFGFNAEGEPVPSNANSGVGERADGDGGEVNINTRNISFTNGAGLFTGTFGQGETNDPTIAGNITINAQEDVYFDNSAALSTVEIIENNDTQNDVSRNSQGGTIEITAENLFLTNGATLSASNNLPDPASKAGNVEIEAETINMDNFSLIETDTDGGDGGNIGINSRDVIMRDGSQIRTDAGRAGLPGNGGNITINTELLVGLNRSHIAANAYSGQGGTIEINADGVFVFEVYSRERLEKLFGADGLETFDPTILPRSSITSISLTNPSLSGIVEINDFDPTRGLIELPRNVVDPNELINQDPCKQGQESELYIRGRGGIQVTPDDKLDGGEIEVDLVEPVPSRQRNRRNSTPDQSRTNTEENQPISSLDLVPARGWIRDENGDVILVDYDPTQTGVQRPQPRQQNPNVCQPVSENLR